MNFKKEKTCAKENGISFFKKTLTFKRKLVGIICNCRDKESNSSKLSTKTRENFLNAIKEWPGCNSLKTRSMLLNIWSSKWEFLMKKSKVFCMTTRTLGPNSVSFNLNTIKFKENWRTSCALDLVHILKNMHLTQLLLTLFHKTPKDSSKELKNSKTLSSSWNQSNQLAISLRWNNLSHLKSLKPIIWMKKLLFW